LKTVIIPTRNQKDLIDVPKKARNELKIIPVEHMDQVLDYALNPEVKKEVKPPRPRRKKEKEKPAGEEVSKAQNDTVQNDSIASESPEMTQPESQHQDRPKFRIVLD